ncbi:MAG: DUF3794 domain-containing protein [Lachnospiraceae bacterium]|nr:DUF3794 domain-containing protein [Lachnospiraceae bacterium]
MEIKRKYIHRNHEKGRVPSQITLDDDYNLPDYKPDIVKVMRERGSIKFENIQVNDGHINVKGSLRFDILYRSDMEERKIDSLSGGIPFEETISMDGITELDPVHISADIEDITIGIINSRKLSIRALVMLRAEARDVREEQMITDIEGTEPLEMRRKFRNILQLVTCKKDNYRFRQEIDLPQSKPNIDQILWKSIQLRGVETRLQEGAIQLTGEVRMHLLYYTQGEERRLEWLDEALPLNGSISCDECRENQLERIKVVPANVELEVKPDLDGEDRSISLDMTLDLDICIWEEENMEILEDVYSLTQEIIPSCETLELSTLLAKNYAKCKISDRLSLGKEQENMLQICACEGEVFIDHAEPEGAGIRVEGSLNVELMYITTDDAMPIDSYKGTLGFEQFIEIPETADTVTYELEAGLEQLSAVLLDNTQVDIKAIINLNLIAFSNQVIEKMTDIEVRERNLDELQKQPGIVGYIVKEDDSLWNIAKANHTTMVQLIDTNELNSEEIKKGDKLLIVKTV